jgi:hypothetical protein
MSTTSMVRPEVGLSSVHVHRKQLWVTGKEAEIQYKKLTNSATEKKVITIM